MYFSNVPSSMNEVKNVSDFLMFKIGCYIRENNFDIKQPGAKEKMMQVVKEKQRMWAYAALQMGLPS